jgi:hypothetical protein
MEHYFFHIVTRHHKIVDGNGQVLSSLSAAHEHALGLMHRTMISLDLAPKERWLIDVTNSNNHSELVVLFPCRRRFVIRHGGVPLLLGWWRQ